MFFDANSQDFYVDANGDVYVRDTAAEFAGIGSFFKKLGKIALPVAGIALNAIPGLGTAASVAINSGLSVGGSLLEQSGAGGGAADQAAQANQLAQQAIEAVTAVKNECAGQKAGEIRYSQRDDFRARTQAVIDALESGIGQTKKESARNILRAAKQKCYEIVGEMNRLIDTPGATAADNDMIFDSVPAVQAQPISAGGGAAGAVTLPSGQTVVPQQTANGIVYVPVSDSGGGLDATTLVMFGGGALLLLLLLRK